MSRAYILTRALSWILAITAISAASGEQSTFRVLSQSENERGYIVQEFSGDRELKVVVNPGDFANNYSGKSVRAQLSQRADGSMLLHNIYVDDAAALSRLEQANANLRRDTVERGRRVFRLEGEYIPEFGAWNEYGDVVTDKDFRGKYLVVNFIFTRCPTPDMCPAQTMRMARLQRELKDSGRTELVELVSFTLDPEYDSPGILRDYAETRGLDLSNFTLLTAPKKAMEDLYRQFGIVAYEADGTIDHTMGTLLISPMGKILYRKSGSRWSVNDFLKALETAQDS